MMMAKIGIVISDSTVERSTLLVAKAASPLYCWLKMDATAPTGIAKPMMSTFSSMEKSQYRNDQQLNKADSIDLEVSCDFFEFKSSDLKADAEHGQRCGGVTDHFYGAADQVRQLDVQQE